MIPQSKTNMAEGGEEPTDNPFSFKKFVEQKGSDMEETASDESADDTGDMLDLPDVQSTGVRDADRSRRLPVGDGKCPIRRYVMLLLLAYSGPG